MIVTIDGPAGAGKSSVARGLAERLGFHFLDTGAMYRAVTLAAMRRQVALDDAAALAELTAAISIRFDADRVLLDGEDVSDAIRTPAVTANVRYAADSPGVRQQLIGQQRQVADGVDIVTEGRDQGTLAFPNADCKFFLTATAGERAKRRQAELAERGETRTVEQLLVEQTERDKQDSEREFGRLMPAGDAVVMVTDGLSVDEVVTEMEAIVQRRGGRSA